VALFDLNIKIHELNQIIHAYFVEGAKHAKNTFNHFKLVNIITSIIVIMLIVDTLEQCSLLEKL